jgi:hypothetical protein
MKRFSILASVFVLLFGITGMAHAYTITQTLDYNNNGAGYFFVPSDNLKTTYPYYRYQDDDWGWHHSFGPAPISINSAKLEIEAYDVDPGEVNLVTGDGLTLGNLTTGADIWETTVFNFNSSLMNSLLDGSLDVWIDIDRNHTSDWWAVSLRSSTLTVDYEIDQGGGTSPTPEPATMLLLGSGLVGLTSLRKKFKK